MKKYIMKLRRVSTHSYSVTLPKELVKDFGWKEKQKLVLSRRGHRREIIISDWKSPKPRKRA